MSEKTTPTPSQFKVDSRGIFLEPQPLATLGLDYNVIRGLRKHQICDTIALQTALLTGGHNYVKDSRPVSQQARLALARVGAKASLTPVEEICTEALQEYQIFLTQSFQTQYEADFWQLLNKTLRAKEVQAIRLKYVELYSYKEILNAMHVCLSQVYGLVESGIRELRYPSTRAYIQAYVAGKRAPDGRGPVETYDFLPRDRLNQKAWAVLKRAGVVTWRELIRVAENPRFLRRFGRRGTEEITALLRQVQDSKLVV